MPDPVDYDALAAKHGGAPAAGAPAVDYEALAAQHGGAPTDLLTTGLKPRPLVDTGLKVFPGESSGSMVGDAMLGGVSSIAQIPLGAYDLARKAIPALPAPPDYLHSWAVPPDTGAGKVGEFAGDVASFMLPGGLEEKVLGKIGATSRLGSAAAKAGVSAASAGAMEGLKSGGDPMKTGMAALSAGGTAGLMDLAGKPILHAVTDLWGKATGAGGEAIRTAYQQEASKGFADAMRYRKNESEVVGDLNDAVKQVMTKRGNDYRAAMGQLDQSIRLNPQSTIQELNDQLKAYKVNPLSGRKTVFSASPIVNKEDQALILRATGDVAGWKDFSPAGMDILKQRLTGYAADSSGNTQPFFYRLAQTVRDELNANVPGYQALTKDYSDASDLLKTVTKELSANASNPGTTMRKLTYIFNQNNEFRKILLESLDDAAGSDLKNTMAGYALRTPTPRGLAGVAAGLSVPAALMHNPAIMGGLAFGSPRVAGEAMALLSALRRNTPGVVKRLAPAADDYAPAITNQVIGGQLTPPPARLSPPPQ